MALSKSSTQVKSSGKLGNGMPRGVAAAGCD
jgi:hypothetical protein